MKKSIFIIVLGMLFFTSCQKDEELYGYSDTTEWEEGSEDEFDDSDDTDGDGTDDEDSDESHAHGVEGAISLYKVNGESISLLKDFDVSGQLKAYQDDKQKHQDIWNFVTRLIPSQYRNKISEFELFYGGGEFLGYVISTTQDLDKWKFALAIDEVSELSEIDFSNNLTYTAIHELGHVITLNDDQLIANQESCNNYHTGEGCSRDDSYIQRIFDIGWKDIIDEHIGSDPYDIYMKYKSRFISDYAATNPAEDIAEVFTYFIIQSDKPKGNTIADQKVRALYDFPDLVQLRADVRASIPSAQLSTLTLDGYKAVLPKLVKGHSHK